MSKQLVRALRWLGFAAILVVLSELVPDGPRSHSAVGAGQQTSVSIAGSTPQIPKRYFGVFVAGPSGLPEPLKTVQEGIYAASVTKWQDSLKAMGWDQANMETLVAADATVANLTQKIGQFKQGGARQLGVGDEFHLYFAGHGSESAPNAYISLQGIEIDGGSVGDIMSGFDPAVTISFMIDSCHSVPFAVQMMYRMKNGDGKFYDANHLHGGAAGRGVTFGSFMYIPGVTEVGNLYTIKAKSKLSFGLDSNGNGIIEASEFFPILNNDISLSHPHDDDNDGLVDEDGGECCCPDPMNCGFGANQDFDGYIDEDPPPQYPQSIIGVSVGGILDPEIAGPEAATSEPASTRYALWTGIAAAGAVGAVTLGAGLWYARRRRAA